MTTRKSVSSRGGPRGASPWWLTLVLPAASGLLLIPCQPPMTFFFLAYVALVPLLFSLERERGGSNFLKGFAAGVVCYVGLIYWVVVAMNRYGGISLPLSILTMLLLVCYVAVYVGCFAWSIAFLRDRFSVPVYLTAPFLWAILEYGRAFLLSGFPWSFLGHSQYNFLTLIQIASVTGTYFISLLIVAVNCLIYQVLKQRRFPIAYGSVVVALFVASLIFGVVRLGTPMGKGSVRTSIVQGNIRQDLKFDEAYKNSTVQTYTSLTLQHARGADLIIWPETAMPFIFLNDGASAPVRGVPAALSNHLLLGTISRDDRGRYYNTAYVIGVHGEIVGAYSKKHLVPFGEYTPLTSYFPFLENISVAAGNFFPGPSHSPITTPVGKVGLVICYEGIFPYITNETVRAGAEVLVNITNDAWFGPTSAPYQHFAFYIFRAVETDRYVLRAANTGISAVIDPRGRTIARTGIFREEILNGTFSPRQSRTFYVTHGDWLILLSFLFLCGLLLYYSVLQSLSHR
jgi:apolipoprotein N-acyltransferase